MSYTLQEIKLNPSLLTYKISWQKHDLTLRPLISKDNTALTLFLESLSTETRENYVLNDYGKGTADEFCESIAKYDKLRLVLLQNDQIIGLFEYSMDIPSTDKERLQKYGFIYDEKTICRFGPCVSDDFQGKGLVTTVFPSLCDIALKMGMNKMLLWGGVFTENTKAVKYYLRMGFIELGNFVNQDRKSSKDMLLELQK